MLLLNFANACFNAGATRALHRNSSPNWHTGGKSQDCFPTKTGFSASSKWSHSKLLKSKGSLKDKAAWQSLVFPLLPHAFMLKSSLLVCFSPFGLNFETPVTWTGTNWAQRTVMILQAFSNSRVQLVPISTASLVLTVHINSPLPDFHLLKEGNQDSPNKVTHQQNPASNYNYCSYDSSVSLLIEISAQ